MSDAMRAIETLSESVMGAIREQGVAGRTISRNVADAGRAGADAGEMGGLARSLADKADTLDRRLGEFLGALAAA